MPSGGARNRSGPRPSETSTRSDRRGYTLNSLPSEGYRGPVPDFPLDDATDRELEVWAAVWRTPQACAWALPSEAWRLRTVAMYCRVEVRCEAPDAAPSLLAQRHRFADQVGLTTAGLAEMGWKVAVDEVAAASAARTAARKTPAKRARRMRPVPDDAAAG